MENVSSGSERAYAQSLQPTRAQPIQVLVCNSTRCVSRDDSSAYQSHFLASLALSAQFDSILSQAYLRQMEADREAQRLMDSLRQAMMQESFDNCLRSSFRLDLPQLQLRDYLQIVFQERPFLLDGNSFPSFWEYSKSVLKNYECAISSWSPPLSFTVGHVFRRQGTYRVPPKNMLMSKKSLFTENHSLLVQPRHLVFDVVVTATHVPFSDNFYILNRQYISKKEHGIHIEHLQKIVFNKKFALQGMIKSATSKETNKIQEKYINQPIEKVVMQEFSKIDEERMRFSIESNKHLFQVQNDLESSENNPQTQLDTESLIPQKDCSPRGASPARVSLFWLAVLSIALGCALLLALVLALLLG